MAAASITTSAPMGLVSWFRNWFLLEGATRRVGALASERQALLRRYYDAGLRRTLVADDLTDTGGLVGAFALYREAVALFAAALVLAQDPAADPVAAAAAPWEALAGLGGEGRFPLPPNLDGVRQILTPAGPLALDDTPPDTLRDQHATVRTALRALRDLIEPRTLRELQMSRNLRVGIVGVAAVLLVVWAIGSIAAPDNIALHRVVTISQRHPASVAPADNSGLVNGEIEPNYGIHTAQGNPWVMIDLGAVYALKDVVVHNRADGWFDQGLPFMLDLSLDGAHFDEVDKRAQAFSASSPWVYTAGGHPARFVRVRSNAYIALTEIEVHGSKR